MSSALATSQLSQSVCLGWLICCEWKRKSHVFIGVVSQKAQSQSHLPSTEKLSGEEQLSFLMTEKINTGRTSILRDWVIDRRGAVVLPRDWAIDSGRGFALGFDWHGRSGSSWEAAECLSRQSGADVGSPLSCNHLPSSPCPVPLRHRCTPANTHIQHNVSTPPRNLKALYDGTTAVMQQGLTPRMTNTVIYQCAPERSIWLAQAVEIRYFIY